MSVYQWGSAKVNKDIRDRYLVIENAPSIDIDLFTTLLEENGGSVETVDSLTAAAKKLRSKPFTCIFISADETTSLTQIQSAISDQLVFILHEGSYIPSQNSLAHDENIHVLQCDTYNIRETITQIQNTVSEYTLNEEIDQYMDLQITIRHTLSSFQTSDSREELEMVVCEQLVSTDLYTTGWISLLDESTDTLLPHTAVGTNLQHLSSISTLDWCTTEIQVDGNRESGYTITVPLHSENTLFGILCLTTFRNIDTAERDLLRELGDDFVTAIQRIDKPSPDSSVDDMVETYAQSFSHELRNNIQTAKAELKDVGDDDIRVDQVRAVLDRIERLDQEALLLTQPSLDEEQLATQSLSAIAEDIQTRMPQLVDRVAIQEDTSIVAHRPLVELLLENLFRNSLDHAGTDAEIRVGTTDDGFFVEDTGNGLPDVPVESLFEWGTTVNGNSGIGLAIVKRVAELHGWNIRVTESTEGGTRFEIVVHADNQPIPSESGADTENAINIGTSGLEDDSDDL